MPGEDEEEEHVDKLEIKSKDGSDSGSDSEVGSSVDENAPIMPEDIREKLVVIILFMFEPKSSDKAYYYSLISALLVCFHVKII